MEMIEVKKKPDEIVEVLKQIHKECYEHPAECEGCRFRVNTLFGPRCAMDGRPDMWEVDALERELC